MVREPQTTASVLRRLILPGAFLAVVTFTWLKRGREAELAMEQAQEAQAMESFSGQTMGTTYAVKIQQQLRPEQRVLVQQRIDAELAAVNSSMSTWQQDSELSRFNRHPVGEPMVASQGLRSVVEISKGVWEKSGGAFDPTIGPLVDLWGFGPTTPTGTVPSDLEIELALEQVDFPAVTLGADTLSRSREDLRLDLSAVAKGYGVDQVSMALNELGFESHMVEVGGEVRAGQAKWDGQPWRIAVERPNGLGGIQEVVSLEGLSMATSGDYRNFFDSNGERKSHTIDPRSGQPIAHGLASVTVLHPLCALADAYATALNVMGPEQGLALAEELQLPVLMLVREGEGLTELRSSHFPELQPRSDTAVKGSPGLNPMNTGETP